jgi:predicted CXXCH cytochrome family protein
LTTADAGYVGTDLSDDHPIGFTFDATLATDDGGLYDPTATDADVAARPGNIDVALLFGTGNDQMECASCHDPHQSDATATPFLRKSNSGSALCLTCHNK